jgi:hypothetical protein
VRKDAILLENGKEHKFRADWVQFCAQGQVADCRSALARDGPVPGKPAPRFKAFAGKRVPTEIRNKKPGHMARVRW